LDRSTVERVVGAFGSGRVEYAGAVWKLFVLSDALGKLESSSTGTSFGLGMMSGRAA
jgi:hypothetical protein